jgi:hypothetical protein
MSFAKCIRACVLLGASGLGATAARADSPERPIQPGIPWPATDELGRDLPLTSEVGPPKSDRFVGVFYFLWHNQVGKRDGSSHGPPDVSHILSADPAALSKPDSPLWGQIGEPHYWGEPLFGYYRSTDPWVLRRHAHMLADAGVDTLVFDTTNAATYPDVYLKLCEVFSAIRSEGGRTPQIAFMVNTNAEATANQIFSNFYAKGLYPHLWFRWQGKPLLLCDPQQANPTLRNFFTLRRAHWPFRMEDTDQAWQWEASYPQPFGFDRDPTKPEQLSVSVAQNLRVSDAAVTNMSEGNARGRSFHEGRQDARPGAVNFGFNFEEQWQRVFALKPQFVLATGWNEWIAGRFQRPNEPVVFVDQFSEEFSRDIEPMFGATREHRRYPFRRPITRSTSPATLPSGTRSKRLSETTSARQFTETSTVSEAYITRTARAETTSCKRKSAVTRRTSISGSKPVPR